MGKNFAEYSDADLYHLVQQKGRDAEAAFTILYDRLSPRIYKYCRRVLGHQGLAEDIFQETFIKFYKSADQQDRRMTNVAGFVLKIARNLCLNAKSSKYYGLANLEDFNFSTRGEQYEDKELLEIVKSAVECLPIDYREAFILRDYDGMSYPEIAEILSISIPTVKIRIFRARKKLRKILSPYVNDLSK